jgi:hypothetical protein
VFRLALFLLILSCSSNLARAQATPAPEKKRFVLYATLIEDVPVQLSDGSRWNMDKGDTFPLTMYKEQGTKMILQLASATFMVNSAQAKAIEEKDLTELQLQSYRNIVQNFLDSRAAKWRKEQAK